MSMFVSDVNCKDSVAREGKTKTNQLIYQSLKSINSSILASEETISLKITFGTYLLEFSLQARGRTYFVRKVNSILVSEHSDAKKINSLLIEINT